MDHLRASRRLREIISLLANSEQEADVAALDELNDIATALEGVPALIKQAEDAAVEAAEADLAPVLVKIKAAVSDIQAALPVAVPPEVASQAGETSQGGA